MENHTAAAAFAVPIVVAGYRWARGKVIAHFKKRDRHTNVTVLPDLALSPPANDVDHKRPLLIGQERTGGEP